MPYLGNRLSDQTMFGAILGLWGALMLIGQWLAVAVALWLSPGVAFLLWSIPAALVVVALGRGRVHVASHSLVRQWAVLQVGLLAATPGYFYLAVHGRQPDVLIWTAILITSASTLWIGGSLWRSTARLKRQSNDARGLGSA